jgi:hypothetical protein
MALVAAGANTLAQLKYDPLAELNAKVSQLETAQYAPKADEARERFSAMRQEVFAARTAELAAKVKKVKDDIKEGDWEYMVQWLDDGENETAVVSRRVRERLAKEGKAMPDGSYPIRNVNDLKNAIQAYGRSKPGSRAAVRKHIMRSAKRLKKQDLIPAKWSTQYNAEGEELSLRERILAVAAVLNPTPEDLRNRAKIAAEFVNSEALFSEEVLTAAGEEEDDLKDLTPEEIEALKQELRRSKEEPKEEGKYTPQTQPRDAAGKFRKVLARLKSDLGTSGLQDVLEKVEEAENLDSAGNYAGAAKAAGDLLEIIDRLDAKALNPESLENVRNSARELGSVIANLPFAFGEEAEKIRFSDVPPALRDLMESMIERVEQKIGKEDADIATENLKSFMSGGDYYNQSEISSEMSKLLRLLT